MLQFYIPEVLAVEQVIPEHEKIADKEFSKLEEKLQASSSSSKESSADETDPILNNIKPRPSK
jgi:hypothetical protein